MNTDERPRLINVAYRLLGSLSDAEDVVQEAYGRWYALPADRRAAIASPGAWLTTVTARICLDLLGSARARRERYVGAWLPEPLPPAGDPADHVTLDESVTMAFLVVLDTMTPPERVAFVLHDVFGYPFADVAGVLDRSPAACRQLASAGRRRVRSAQSPPGTGSARVVRAFRKAWEAKDIPALIGLLDPHATATADGGGLVPTAPRPLAGATAVAGYAVAIARRASLTLAEHTVNGRPGLILRQNGVTTTVLSFDIAGDRIRHIWAVRNPEKLRRWRAA